MNYPNRNYNGNGRQQYAPRNNYQQRGNGNGGYGNQQQQQAPFDGEMRGKAWQNTQATHPKAPQFTGVCTILGVDYRVSIWFGHEQGKGDVLTLKFQNKQEARRQQHQNGGANNGYAPPQNNGYSGPPQGNYAPPPQPQNGGYRPPQNPPQAPQPAYAGNRNEDTPWPNDGAPPAEGPGEYGNDDPWA